MSATIADTFVSLSAKSEQHPHNQVKLIGAHTAGGERKGSQRAEFSRKEKVGAGPVNKIRKLASVAGYIGSNVTRGEKESAQVGRIRSVLSAGCIDFKFHGWLEFELGPTTCAGQSAYRCRRIAEGTIEHHTPADAGAEPTDGSSGVEFAAELKILSEGDAPVRVCNPAVDSAIEAPILAVVIASYCQNERLTSNLVTPFQTASVARLPGTFSGAGNTQELIRWRFSGKRIKNSTG